MKLAYKIEGKGMPVVLLHAFPLSSKMWDKERAVLAQEFMVITPDFPGFGASPRQKTPSLSEMAKDVAALLDELKIDKAFVGGLSMGGYVTFEFLNQFPERVKGLGIFSTRAAADKTEIRDKRFKTIDAIEREGLPPFAGKILENLLGKTTREKNPVLTAEVKKLILSADPEGVKDALRAMAGRQDLDHLLAKIHCPSLIVAGDEDPFVPVEETQGIHQRTPGSILHLFSKTGHMVNFEQPVQFQSILRSFLAKCL